MHIDPNRRTFLGGLAATVASPGLPVIAAPGPAGIRFGYTAMTWGDQERQAMDDIAAVGFVGIQFRANALTDFNAAELKPLLGRQGLTFVALSSGDVSMDRPAGSEIAQHAAHAQFVKDSGGLYLQVLDELKPYPRSVTGDECKRLGELLTEIGKRTAEIGVPLGYHNHVNTIGEHPANLELVLEHSDPRYVKLLLDTAHAVAGGGDPARMIEQYQDRLLFLHLKDVQNVPMNPKLKYPFLWVELGRGKVDFHAVFRALERVRYRGWAVVELDRVPDPSRTPKQCAIISRDYLAQAIGIAF